MQNDAVASQQQTSTNAEPGKMSRILWMSPALVLIPFIFQFAFDTSFSLVEIAALIAGLGAAALVGRHLYQSYESNRRELEQLRSQALDNCAQRDAAIGALGNFFSEVLPIWARQIKMAQDHAREEVEVLAQHFDTIVNSLDSSDAAQNPQEDGPQVAGECAEVVEQRVVDLSAEERQEIRDSLDKILVSLQFQDRVNQILEAVGLNLEQIAAHIDQILDSDSDASLEEVLSLTSWLELMQENYTMVEQKMVHHDECVSAAPSADSNEIEFF